MLHYAFKKGIYFVKKQPVGLFRSCKDSYQRVCGKFLFTGEDNKAAFGKLKQNSVKIGANEARSTHLRIAWQDIFDSKRQKVKENNTNKSRNNVTISSVRSEVEPVSLFIMRYFNYTYYINPFMGFSQTLSGSGIKLGNIDYLLFTRLDWKTITSTLNRWPQIKGKPTVVIGPPGISECFNLSSTVTFSWRARQLYQQTFNFVESTDKITEYNRGNLQMKIVNLKQDSTKGRKTDGALMNPGFACVKGVNAYIFSNKRKSDMAESAPLEFTHLNFESVEEYIAYIENSKIDYSQKDAEELPFSFVVVDCPNEDYFNNLILDDHIYDHHVKSNIICIFHASAKDLFYSEKYQIWMKKFGPNCRHIYTDGLSCHSDMKSKLFRGVLHTIEPYFFPLHGNKIGLEALQDFLSSSSQFMLQYYTLVQNNLECINRKNLKIDSYAKKMLHPVANCTSHKPLDMQNGQFVKSHYPRLVVLGSGSSFVTPIRCTPSYLIQVDESTSILLDCGDHTLNQLHSHFGSRAAEAIRNIKLIVVTHRHNDHWGGLVNVMDEVLSLSESGCFVFLPKSLANFITKYACNYFEESVYSKANMLSIEYLNSIGGAYTLQVIAKKLKLDQVGLVPVDHGIPTFGVVMNLSSGHKVVYSSDTLPMCKALIRHGMNADLLIHDCLYISDAYQVVASMKLHSTARGAIATAESMKAKNILLTHFSARYRQFPFTDMSIDEPYSGNILCAFDNLEVSLDELHVYHDVYKQLMLQARVTKDDTVHNKLASEVAESLQIAKEGYKET